MDSNIHYIKYDDYASKCAVLNHMTFLKGKYLLCQSLQILYLTLDLYEDDIIIITEMRCII